MKSNGETGRHGVPVVSVIVPVYRDDVGTARLLAALEAQDFPHHLFECVLVDNDVRPALCLERAASFPLTVVHEPKPGSYAARNRGVATARAPIFAFTDADCLPGPTWLSTAVDALTKRNATTVLAGHVEMFAEDEANAVEWYSVVNELLQSAYVAAEAFGATANLIVPRDLFETAGLFDDTLKSSGDKEWCVRAAKRGAVVEYVPQLVVRHPARATWRALEKRARRIMGGRYSLASRGNRPFATSFWSTLGFARQSFARSMSDPRLERRSLRFKVAAIDVVVRAIQLDELVRLKLGSAPRRD